MMVTSSTPPALPSPIAGDAPNTARSLAEAASTPLADELLRTFLRTHAADRRLLQVAVLGSHGCGYATPGAPYELKGIYIEATENLVGLLEPPRSTNWVGEFEGVCIDFTALEVGQALRALLRGDGSLLERLLAPHQLVQTPNLDRLQALARGTISRHYYGHYRHSGRGGRHAETGLQLTPSYVLSGYRIALTGAHLFRAGELLLHLPTLARLYDLEQDVALLIERQRTDPQAHVDPEGRYGRLLQRLQAAVEESIDASDLPLEPDNARQVGDFLLELRRRYFDADTIPDG